MRLTFKLFVKVNKDPFKTFGNFNIKANLQYICDDTPAHRLDIYTPVKNGNGITLFYIHGGGYCWGDKADSQPWISFFVDKGFNVVSINYRYGSYKEGVNFKDQMKDVFAALNFTAENKLEYKITTDKMFILGDSAGGHMAMMVDVIYKSKEAQEFFGIDKLPNFNICGVVGDSPMYNYKLIRDQALKMITKRDVKNLFSINYKDDDFINKCSTHYYYNKGVKPSPLFVSTCYHDYFYSQSKLCSKDCERLGYDIDFYFEASPNKKLAHDFNHTLLVDEGLKCNLAIVDFLNKNVKVDK